MSELGSRRAASASCCSPSRQTRCGWDPSSSITLRRHSRLAGGRASPMWQKECVKSSCGQTNEKSCLLRWPVFPSSVCPSQNKEIEELFQSCLAGPAGPRRGLLAIPKREGLQLKYQVTRSYIRKTQEENKYTNAQLPCLKRLIDTLDKLRCKRWSQLRNVTLRHSSCLQPHISPSLLSALSPSLSCVISLSSPHNLRCLKRL